MTANYGNVCPKCAHTQRRSRRRGQLRGRRPDSASAGTSHPNITRAGARTRRVCSVGKFPTSNHARGREDQAPRPPPGPPANRDAHHKPRSLEPVHIASPLPRGHGPQPPGRGIPPRGSRLVVRKRAGPRPTRVSDGGPVCGDRGDYPPAGAGTVTRDTRSGRASFQPIRRVPRKDVESRLNR